MLNVRAIFMSLISNGGMSVMVVSLPPRFEPRLTLAPAPPSASRGPCRRLSLPFSCAQIIMTGMGRTLVDEMVKVVSDNHGTAPPCRDPKCVDLYTTGAPGAYPTARRGAAFQSRCSHGGGRMDSLPQEYVEGMP